MSDYLGNITSEIRAFNLANNIPRHYIMNKDVIDIGTKDGSNAIMLKNLLYAKTVTGIDINSSLFPSQKYKDIDFINLSIQDFSKTSNKLFDTATIFLWNIPVVEYQTAINATYNILKKNGVLIIGIHDQSYIDDKYLSVINLLWNNNFIIKEHKNNNNILNRHLLYAYKISK